MPTTSRPKTEDKFSRARAAKNSPERQGAVAKKTPRGPSSVRPASAKSAKAPADAAPKIRDEERVFSIVHAILTAWKAEADHPDAWAASAGIIKVSRRKIEGALRDLKNTRFTKIPTLINDILTGCDICDEFGHWVYVEHDSPDWIFVRLPANSTPVIRADISYDKTGVTSAAVTTSSELLMEDLDEDEEEDEIPENVEYDDEDDSDVNEDEEDE